MRKFTDNQLFITSVQNNDKEEIKRLLIDNIIFLQGSETEIFNAVKYAQGKSDFIFEEHIEQSIENSENDEDLFSEEMLNMKMNYSKERFEQLVALYNKVFPHKEYSYDTETSDTSNNKIIKAVAVGIAIVLAGYVIYKILD